MSQATLGKIIADFETSLATAIAVGATSVTIQSATDDDGVALPIGRYFLTLDGNNSSKEHIACTLTSTSITDIKTVSRQGTETSGCLRAHRVGAKVVITDFAHIKKINDLLDGTTKFDPSVVLEYSATASITTANQLATKDYADGLAIAGSPDASTTVKGIAFMSTGPASATGPIAVGTNDTRIPSQAENDALAGTSGTPSSTNKYVTSDDVSSAGATGKIIRADATGKIASSMLTGNLPAISGASLTGITDTQIADLNGYIGSQGLNSGANTITAGYQSTWRMCVATLSDSDGRGGDVIILKTGKTSGATTDREAANSFGISLSATGTTITMTASGLSTGPSGTAYYYR